MTQSILKLPQSLTFQISIALVALISLFAIAGFHSIKRLSDQQGSERLLQLGGQLQLVTQHIAMQAMAYKDNAPRDFKTYNRDLNLYFRDLASELERLDTIIEAFASNHFPAELIDLPNMMAPPLAEETRLAAIDLHDYWQQFYSQINEKLGTDPGKPRLEWAAEAIIEKSSPLQDKTLVLVNRLEADIKQRQQDAAALYRLFLFVAFLLSAGILAWFYYRVLRPLNQTIAGFHRVSSGDFQHKISVSGHNEISLLANSFNHLTGSLDKIFRLIARLQEGSNLDQTLEFIAGTLPELLPLDWVGILFTSDNEYIQLERIYSDGRQETMNIMRFKLAGTLLEKCLQQNEPIHIPDIEQVSGSRKEYRFLRVLRAHGRRDAIFLPVIESSPLPGVLVFASRQAHSYRQEHIDLLKNLSLLITVSFGKTLRLAEHARLAAIGQFASGIAHEIRSPLATVSLALDYFQKTDLEENAEKRLLLAISEVGRIGRLLEDVLLYAKPLRLKTQEIDLIKLLNAVINSQGPFAGERDIQMRLNSPPATTLIMGDSDRLSQVFINLLANAIEASPDGTEVRIEVIPDSRHVQIRILNQGEPISPGDLDQLFEPFFTTRASGTGLGLSIVRRILDAQGGTVAASSNPQDGTVFTVTLPLHSAMH